MSMLIFKPFYLVFIENYRLQPASKERDQKVAILPKSRGHLHFFYWQTLSSVKLSTNQPSVKFPPSVVSIPPALHAVVCEIRLSENIFYRLYFLEKSCD